MEDFKELLQKYFGHAEFRRGQKEIIESVISGKNTVVVMPTGGGKSLCYQLPALHFDGVTIVVSPLIALMKDQVDGLTEIGIPATFINSSISESEMHNRMREVKSGKFKLLYVAPERFNNDNFMRGLEDVMISLFAIDEAHCISEWGHDFRPSYLRIKNVLKKLGNPTVITLTATATPEVKEDIIKQLELEDPEIFVTGFDRPNITFAVQSAQKTEKMWAVLKFIKEHQGSGIIYAGTRNMADEVAAILQTHNIKTINYHAGLDPEERKNTQEAFMKGKYRVIVATNAFGMGIDKPDIRFVIHFNLPGTLEAYYQEAGRAGRDGQESHCLLLFHSADRYLQEFFLKGDNPSRENIEETYRTLQMEETSPILMTYNEIASQLSDDVPEMTVGTAIKILERYGYISTAKENEKEGFIKNLSADILDAISTRAKVKRKIIEYFMDIYGSHLDEGVNFNMDVIVKNSGLKKDSINRALRGLKADRLIEYEPPFRGKEIYLEKDVPYQKLKIDYAALEKKLERDTEKLNIIEGYARSDLCRCRYILEYFGEQDTPYSCGKCDNCNPTVV